MTVKELKELDKLEDEMFATRETRIKDLKAKKKLTKDEQKELKELESE